MGSQSVRAIQTKEDRKNFISHLLDDVSALEYMLENNLFESGIKRIGAEQEICIVNENFTPAYNALEILNELNEPHFTTELGLFNLELNLDPFVLKEKCFSKLEQSLQSYLGQLYKKAAELESTKPILTGILPTLRYKDLDFKYITPYQRYRTLNNAMREIRGDDFKLHIQGVDLLKIRLESILFEACNTSFQVHLQIDPSEAVDMYNWSQAISGPMMSLMTNSPLLLGKELWSETRIALFQQSIDLRTKAHLLRGQKPRVDFGNDWIRNSILEIYTDDIARYTPILTSDFDESSLELVKKGIMPSLKALNLHNGTLYKWNRLCYGVHENIAHLRIENRYIPSGPSVKDEIANAMLWIGVMVGMPDEFKNIWEKMSFQEAKGNFTNAARTGIDSYLHWMGKEIPARTLARNVFIPMAENGLKKMGVDAFDIENYLAIIKKRVALSKTGSKWITRNKRLLEKKYSSFETKVILTKRIYRNQKENIPIHRWRDFKFDNESLPDAKNKVYKVMTKELFVISPDDLVDLVAKIMEWKNIRHVPVINKENKIVGMINKELLATLSSNTIKNMTAEEVMNKDFIAVDPDMLIEDLKKELEAKHVTSAAVIYQNELIGIVTTKDLEIPVNS